MQRPLTTLWMLALPLGLCHCQQAPTPKRSLPKTITYKKTYQLERFPKKGEVIGRLWGGSLTKPVPVTSWITYDKNPRYDYFKCDLIGGNFRYFEVAPHLLYVQQDNSRCAGGSVCKVLDLRTKRWKPVLECFYGMGTSFTVHPLGQDLYFVFSYMEGSGLGKIERWRPGQRAKEILGTTSSDLPRWKQGFLYIKSHYNPVNGAKSSILKKACGLKKKCPYNIAETQKASLWRWHPQQPKLAIEIDPISARPLVSNRATTKPTTRTKSRTP